MSHASDWCPPSEPGTPPPDLGQVVPVDLMESTCYRGMQPISLTGTILEYLRVQFKQPNTLGEMTLRNKVWSKNGAKDENSITIESIFRWKAKDVGNRPTLLVKPHGWRYNSISINDMVRYENNQYVFAVQVFGTHTVFAIHSNGEGAMWLGLEASLCLLETAPIVRKKLRLQDYKVSGADGIFEIEEARESFAVPINISWMHIHEWKLNQESPILKDVSITPANVLFNR